MVTKTSFVTSFLQPRAHCQLDSSPLVRSAKQIHYIPLTVYCLTYMRLPKMHSQHIFTLKMATAMFAETVDNFKLSMWLIPESRSYTLNSSHENARTRITYHSVH
jgi:hypothetical protein